jgi:hypothetical protein
MCFLENSQIDSAIEGVKSYEETLKEAIAVLDKRRET